MAKQGLLDTVWEVPDDLWAEIAPLIAELGPPKSMGRERQGPRRMLNGIIFRLRSGCQWNQLPRSLGDDSTIHRTFRRWERVLSRCEELGGVDWEWHSADGAMGKARLGGMPLGGTPPAGESREPSAASWSRPTEGR